MNKTYTNAELKALVAEFSAEFDALVKAEVAKTGEALNKSESLAKDEDPKKGPPESDGDESGESAPAESTESAPAESAPADSAPASLSAPADASAPAAPPAASASAPADPASQAAGTDPVSALKAAYAQLDPTELQYHIQALSEVVAAQGGAGAAPAAPAADPAMMGGAASAAPAASPAAPAVPPAAAPGPDAVAPLAGEGSKPVDPAATMALKHELDSKDAEIKELKKSVEQLTEAMTKAFSAPVRKAITAKDVLVKSEDDLKKFESLSKSEVTRRLRQAATNQKLVKSDRDLINAYYRGEIKLDRLTHLLGE